MLSQEIRSVMQRVLTDPLRLRFLFAGGLDDALNLRRFLVHVVPLARRALTRLERLAEGIPDPELHAQALSALRGKAYHVAGACILATFLPTQAREHYVEVVAPLETIYDFLDTLCDRHPETQPEAFRQLHLALFDALDPYAEMNDYYAFGPPGDDGGYLSALVLRVRRALTRLSGHELLLPHFAKAAALYADTQTYKHLAPEMRIPACREWHARVHPPESDLTWWEFGAAAGSQFHVYAALYALFCSDYAGIAPSYDAYFPDFSAIHVLLDAFIDQDEDRKHGELSWVECYEDAGAFAARLGVLTARAREAFAGLPAPRVHGFVLRIMLLFYLTHPKIAQQHLEPQARMLLRELAL